MDTHTVKMAISLTDNELKYRLIMSFYLYVSLGFQNKTYFKKDNEFQSYSII
jgi:hypothetical protein